MSSLRPFGLLLFLALLLSACVPQASPTVQPSPLPPQATAPATPPPTAPAAPPSPTPSGAWMQVSPANAPPGTLVQIQGYLPDGGPSPQDIENDPALGAANVCWDGCTEGFNFQEQRIQWSQDEPGRFTIDFTIPSVPYLKASGPVPLTAGEHRLGLQCLDPAQEAECFAREAEVSAAFRLDEPVPSLCQPGQPCATLSLDPAQGPPGTLVQVRGWAPLVSVIGDMAYGYTLGIATPQGADSGYQVSDLQQSLDGSLTGGFAIPQQLPGAGAVAPGEYTLTLQAVGLIDSKVTTPPTVAQAGFTVEALAAWQAASAGLGQPVIVQPSADLANRVVSADPGDLRRLAYCAPGEIRVSPDGGGSWAAVPTAGAELLAGSLGYTLSFGQPAPPNCYSVTLDAAHPGSHFAVFSAASLEFGAPPVYYLGFYTADNGATWQLAPLTPYPHAIPTEKFQEFFGGYWSDGRGLVQALFNDPSGSFDTPATPLAMETRDGGLSWSQGLLACPPAGACLRWGAASSTISGMGSPAPQSVFNSIDAGETWIDPGLTVELRAAAPNQLAAFSETSAALLSGAGEYPLQVTQDGGITWQPIDLPPLPGSQAGGYGYPGLQILPDGGLLALNADSSGWVLLPPNAQVWCPMGDSSLPNYPLLLQAAAGKLWWLSPESEQLQNLPLSEVTCAGS